MVGWRGGVKGIPLCIFAHHAFELKSAYSYPIPGIVQAGLMPRWRRTHYFLGLLILEELDAASKL